ncbi:hypothetical protein [Rhizobium sp. R693]|uniref:hypothetical protein n=1 Tax=Rhizobium sp. R693 TaxID=1764276 RepID=UPI000B53487D|nr:hypothetical protein [Rhizobium sp. R693]OWV87446.1 hypothetical protein ATY79_29420 [Rhizobium sp. R693]
MIVSPPRNVLEAAAANPYSRALVVAVISLFLSSCDILGFHDWNWSQRLAVTVNTPTGKKTASSVSLVRWEKTPSFLMGLGGGGYSGKLTGEVVVLEIAPSKYLFSLFDDRYEAGTVLNVFFPRGGWGDQLTEKSLNTLEQASHQHSLSANYYPNFVTFRDITDPASVVPVSPEDFEKEFGKGTSLVSVTLSITDEEPIEINFAQILPWWRSYQNDKQLDGSRYTDIGSSHRFANSLNSTNFKRD